HNQDSVAHADDFAQIARNEQNRFATRGQLVDECMNLGFGADIDAARRLIKNHHTGIAFEPANHDCLLLIAATQPRARLPQTRGANAIALARSAHSLLFAASSDHAESTELIGESDTDRIHQRLLDDKALSLTLLGNVNQSGVQCLARATRAPRLAVEPHGA